MEHRQLNQQTAQPQLLEHGSILDSFKSLLNLNSTFRAWLNPRLHQQAAQPQRLKHGSILDSIKSLLNLNF